MTTDTDVTAKVKVGDYEGGMLPLDRCICGREFGGFKFILWQDRDGPESCPDCGRQFRFEISIKVFEVKAT